METKHTPGPWEIVPGDEWTTDIGTPEGEYEDGRKRYWNVASVNKRRDEWEANRRLVSAAPKLLDVAKRSAAALISAGIEPTAHSDNPLEGLLHLTLAAIAKATGRTG